MLPCIKSLSVLQVRVRCVGSEGSGHGTYSEPVTVSTPGNRTASSKAPSARSEASSAAGEPSSLGLVVPQSGKGRARRDASDPSEDDLSAVAAGPAPRRRRKAGTHAFMWGSRSFSGCCGAACLADTVGSAVTASTPSCAWYAALYSRPNYFTAGKIVQGGCP